MEMNNWNVFPNIKPKESGWYQCTVEVMDQQRYVMNLYWYSSSNKFIDNIRQNVCDVYYVTSTFGSDRLHDIGCDRTYDVIAWMELADTYDIGHAIKFISLWDKYDLLTCNTSYGLKIVLDDSSNINHKGLSNGICLKLTRNLSDNLVNIEYIDRQYDIHTYSFGMHEMIRSSLSMILSDQDLSGIMAIIYEKLINIY